MRSAGLLASVLVALTAAVALPQPAAAAVTRTCGDFVAFRGVYGGKRYHYPARHVRRTGDVSCERVRAMIRSTYGRGRGYYKVIVPKAGRATYYWSGGWRCSNGAGGAGCSNVTHPSWSISATVDYADGR